MKTVYTSFLPVEAQLVWSELDAAGFHAQVTHELSALSCEGYSVATGGIQVTVPDSEWADAQEFVKARPGPLPEE